MNAQRGIYIATPEYNASVSPLLKNTIDWVSRSGARGEDPFKRCTFALGATSDGRFGGYRALMALRVDQDVPPHVLEELTGIQNIISARVARFA